MVGKGLSVKCKCNFLPHTSCGDIFVDTSRIITCLFVMSALSVLVNRTSFLVFGDDQAKRARLANNKATKLRFWFGNRNVVLGSKLNV